jgi:hypothetical protein
VGESSGREVPNGLLDAWYPRTIDREHGGFLSRFDHQWRPQESNAHTSSPVAAASATARRVGVEKYSRPSTMIGLTCIDEDAFASPAWYSQAGRSVWTFAAWICASGENWFAFAPPR